MNLLLRPGMPVTEIVTGSCFHPDNFCDPANAKYRDKYAAIARRPSAAELNDSWRRARELGSKFETTTFERRNTSDMRHAGLLKM